HGGDAVNYYYWGAEPLASFRPGTVAINYITSILHQLDLSILGMFLVFNFFGSIGLLFVYASLNTITGNSSLFLRRLVLVFLFLPSVSFWSSSLGKDAISFLAMGIALFSSLNFHKRILLMFIALVLMLLVRPHMAGIMIIAVVISTVLSRDISLIPRFVLGSIGLVTALIMIPFALE
ncbi:hypothetical protein, partial [Vibrio sp. F13]|uniref:hypothetical protein n=2 Tax=Vibrio TaxID=662 RepID=UPI0019D1971C